MAPPVQAFPASELPWRVQMKIDGKRRKYYDEIKLENCELMELVQHSCWLEGYRGSQEIIKCQPIVRLFRKCANGMMVETTAWEGEKGSSVSGSRRRAP